MSEASFFDKLDVLAAVLAKSVRSEAVLQELFELLKDSDVRRHFFQTASDPGLIGPLNKAGFFNSPPPTVAGGSQYAVWPESQYLARMASAAPQEIAGILARIQTDNSQIIRDTVKAALAMPTHFAVQLVSTLCETTAGENLWTHSHDASRLCVRLAQSGETEAAVRLAHALFAPERKDKGMVIRRDEFWYKEGLKLVVPSLVKVTPGSFLPMLTDWLQALVAAKVSDQLSSDDYSYLWRPAIEEHEQNHDYDLASAMVGIVRQAFEQAIAEGKMSFEEAISTVGRRHFLIFDRLRLHLITEFAGSDLVRQTLLDRNLFDDYRLKHEYARLAGRRFDFLSPSERDTWFGWIDSGPDLTDFADKLRQGLGREATEADRQQRVRYWQFEKLHWIPAHLTGERRAFYERMLAAHGGAPDMADLNVRSGGVRRGHNSPMTAEQLGTMTFEKVLESICSWNPKEGDVLGPTTEGLASTFEEYVATSAETLSIRAELLIGRPAIYIRRYLGQMNKAVRDGKQVAALPVLNLCQWVIDDTAAEADALIHSGDKVSDRDWQWTRDEVSSFVESLCRSRTKEDVATYRVSDLRRPIWQLITELCHDRAESNVVRDVTQEDVRLHDYLTLGINSPRGKAIEAALEYARWIAHHTKQLSGNQESVPVGFDVMPEFRELLAWALLSVNSSVGTMAVIGSRINLLYWIDRAWLKENAPRIFNLENRETESSALHGWAAWNAFLVWVPPHIQYYQAFKSQFARAVKETAPISANDDADDQPVHRLGQHLIILYGRGQLGLDDDGGLLRQFIQTAHPSVRVNALSFAGQTIGPKTPPDVIERLQILWDIYWPIFGKADATQKSGASLFGHWFSSGEFPAPWALDRLEQFVIVVPKPEPDHAIAQQLAVIAHVDVAKSVRILDLMVHGDDEGWHTHDWIDSAKEILTTALGISTVRSSAVEVVNELGRRGHTEIGELLKK